MSKDDVNFPEHYTKGDIEVIDAIWSTGHGVSYCIGNALKYLSRAGKKGDLVEDIGKAHWYLDFLLSKLKEDHPDPREKREKPLTCPRCARIQSLCACF